MKNVLFVSIVSICILATTNSFAQTRSVIFEDGQFGKWIITTSSTLKPQKGNSYAPKNIADFSDRTAWIEGAKGNGIGEAIMLNFEQKMNIGTIRLKNGYGKSRSSFTKNSRIKKANIQMDGGIFPVTLKDTMGEQTIKVPAKIRKIPTDRIKLTIKSVYPGTKWQDTALNEFIPDLEEYNYQPPM